MEVSDKSVKIYDVNKKFLGVGHLLSLNSGIIKVKGFNMPEINSKTEVYIEVYSEFYGIMPYYCTVSVAASNQLNANIVRIDPIIERRNSLKVKTDDSFYIDKFERNNEDITKDYPNMKINLLNLSIGGMLISSNYDLKVNDIITFDFQYLKYQIIEIRAKVERIDEIFDSKTKLLTAINYGCIFKRLHDYNESVITKYLYDRQLKLYKNR